MTLPTYATLKLEMIEPHVLLITLNRPDVANAINTQMGHDMLDLWRRLTDDAGDVRCAILTGSGDKIFCAGGDLKERNGMTKQQWVAQHELFERAYFGRFGVELPEIRAVLVNLHTAVIGPRGRARIDKDLNLVIDIQP